MEEFNPPIISDEQKCNNLKSIEKQIRIFAAREDYVSEMLDIEKSSPGQTTETIQKLEADAASLDEKVKDLEGNMLELLPCPKTVKSNNVPKEDPKITATNNKFAVLNTANGDVKDVTPAAPKIRPIMKKLFPEYNLILQDLHRTHPTATNTHAGGYIKIQAESTDLHREITNFLDSKKVQFYVTAPPPATRPLKLVIKGLLVSTDPKEIKKMTSLVKESK
ncbi:uncharacterized protein TNIN_123451 [Trichonephila inaurata madagascariensis]|uniref:Uncharacterized protein n=1 Tax=Trichonephila inaurata madagascariensis TaxID=2747483 RepID=A0A8X6WWM3_9ARAC|nr:uncharacterized protein TNIN_123451 [Trichonephila inaurata madagascariensis]